MKYRKIASIHRAVRALPLLWAIAASGSLCLAQSTDGLMVGAGAKVSTLGVGFEAAAAVSARSNIRGGFNLFGYQRDFTKNGIPYNGQLRFRSVQANYDWYFGERFHISPGLLLYNGNRIDASAAVPGGRSFTIGDGSYFSDPANPIGGSARVDLGRNKVAPMILAGFGNLVRRGSGRFSVSVEGGMVFPGSPDAHLDFAGGACLAPGVACQDVGSSAPFQDNLRKEEQKIAQGVAPYDGFRGITRYYPVVSVGFGIRLR